MFQLVLILKNKNTWQNCIELYNELKGVVYFMSYEIHFDDLASSLLEFGININDFGVDIIEESSSIADLSADFFKATTVDAN